MAFEKAGDLASLQILAVTTPLSETLRSATRSDHSASHHA